MLIYHFLNNINISNERKLMYSLFKHPTTAKPPGKNGGLFDCCVSKCAFSKSVSVNQSKLVPKYVFKVWNNTIIVNKIKEKIVDILLC